MKNILKVLSLLLISIAFTACHKEIPTMLSGNFYTTDAYSSENGLTLYMDGENKGSLPYINTSAKLPLSSKDPLVVANARKFTFMSGTHLFEAKKSDGTVVASAQMTFKFYKNKIEASTTSPIGGAGSAVEPDNATVIWMFK